MKIVLLCFPRFLINAIIATNLFYKSKYFLTPNLFCLLRLVPSVLCHLVHHAESVLFYKVRKIAPLGTVLAMQLKPQSESTEISVPVTRQVRSWQKLTRTEQQDCEN